MKREVKGTQQSSNRGWTGRLKHLVNLSVSTKFGVVLAAFDKAKDFGPGRKNKIIYDYACSEITSFGKGRISFAVVQGEFSDLDQMNGGKLAQLTKVSPVEANPFNHAEFVDLNQFIDAVDRPLDPAERKMSEVIESVLQELGVRKKDALRAARKYPANAAAWINRCIAEPELFEKFCGLPGFILPPLVRPAFGAFGVEIHELPPTGSKLLPYQRTCINRAIFNAVYPTALRPATYVNTQHVADKIPNIGPDMVVVCYGFDPHSQRVRETVVSTLWNRGVAIPPGNIVEAPVRGAWGAEAQQWCESLKVFQAYTDRLFR